MIYKRARSFVYRTWRSLRKFLDPRPTLGEKIVHLLAEALHSKINSMSMSPYLFHEVIVDKNLVELFQHGSAEDMRAGKVGQFLDVSVFIDNAIESHTIKIGEKSFGPFQNDFDF